MNRETPLLNPSELYDKRKNKDASKLRAYNKILEQIYNRIRTISKLPNSQCYLLYTVPPFIFGLPKIDLEDCIVYLIYQLRHAEYQVRYSPPNMMYISWAHHEKSYLIEQSPIMHAMLESAERNQQEMERKEKESSRLLGPVKKSAKKIVKNSPNFFQGGVGSAIASASASATTANYPKYPHNPQNYNINTVLNRPLSNPTAGPPRPAASDYVPPSTFIQNIVNPQNTVSYPKSVPEYFK